MKQLAIGLIPLVLAGVALAEEPLVVKPSENSVDVTLDRLEAIVAEKGFRVVARVDHAAAADEVGEPLRPTQVLIFGNPAVGTALMQSRQRVALDLPVRVAAWEDAEGQVWMGYTDPEQLAARYGIGDRDAVIEKMTGALGAFTTAAGSAP